MALKDDVYHSFHDIVSMNHKYG